jgi:hypothetical protein
MLGEVETIRIGWAKTATATSTQPEKRAFFFILLKPRKRILPNFLWRRVSETVASN